jgi:hypothetical protein
MGNYPYRAHGEPPLKLVVRNPAEYADFLDDMKQHPIRGHLTLEDTAPTHYPCCLIYYMVLDPGMPCGEDLRLSVGFVYQDDFE